MTHSKRDTGGDDMDVDSLISITGAELHVAHVGMYHNKPTMLSDQELGWMHPSWQLDFVFIMYTNSFFLLYYHHHRHREE